MRGMRLLLMSAACAAATAYGNLSFVKNGVPVFVFLSNGNVLVPGWYAENQTDAVPPAEIQLAFNNARMLWTRDGQVHLKNTLHAAATFPGKGLMFNQNSVRNAELSNAGHCDVRGQPCRIWVQSIRFNHSTASANNDALTIRPNRASAARYPEYVKGSYSDPAAYAGGKQVGIMVQFGVQPATITSATLQGISDDYDGVLGSTVAKVVNFTNGYSAEELFSISGTTPAKILKAQDYWNWIVIDGTENSIVDRTGPHTLYCVLGVPSQPWTQINGDPQNPWASALDFAINPGRCNMQNATTAAQAGSAAGTYLFNNYGLQYDIYGGAPVYSTNDFSFYHLTDYMTKARGNVINCYDQAGSLMLLTALVGGSMEYLYMGPFGYLNLINLIGVGLCNNPFYGSESDPYNKPIVGQDDAKRTQFGNHAFVRMGGGSGTIFDDCGGPYLGAGGAQDYLDVTNDRSTTEEANAAGTISNISSYINSFID